MNFVMVWCPVAYRLVILTYQTVYPYMYLSDFKQQQKLSAIVVGAKDYEACILAEFWLVECDSTICFNSAFVLGSLYQ